MDPDSVKCQVQNDQHDQHVNTWIIVGPQRYLMCVYIYWLVVSTPSKNISQLGLLFPIYGKTKNVPNHQPVYIYIYTWKLFRQPRHIMDSWVLNLHVSHAFFIHHFIFTFFFNFLTLCRVIQTLPPFLSMMSQFKNEKNLSRFSQDPPHFPKCFPGISMFF